MKNKINSVQEWLPYVYIYDNGIIKLKNNSFVKIIKVSPINFNLKSNLEKEAILNSYKTFLKTYAQHHSDFLLCYSLTVNRYDRDAIFLG